MVQSKSLLRQAIETTEAREEHPEELTEWVRQSIENRQRMVFLRCLLIAAAMFFVACLIVSLWIRLG